MHNNEKKGLFLNTAAFLSNFLGIFFWITAIYGFTEAGSAGLILLAAGVHEIGHTFFIWRLGRRTALPVGRATGFIIKGGGYRSYGEEAAVLLGGVIANLAFATATLPFLLINSAYAGEVIVINLSTAAGNMLPVRGNDGYGLIRCIFDRVGAGKAPYAMLRMLSFTIILCACALSLYALARYGEGYWIFGLYFSLLLRETGGEEMPNGVQR